MATSSSISFETYYCYDCGISQSHALCGETTVYMACRGCGGVGMFSKDKDALVRYWEHRITRLKMLVHSFSAKKDDEATTCTLTATDGWR